MNVKEYSQATDWSGRLAEIRRALKDLCEEIGGPRGTRGDFVARLLRAAINLTSDIDRSDFRAIAAEQTEEAERLNCPPTTTKGTVR
jgi:hypothetical protein